MKKTGLLSALLILLNLLCVRAQWTQLVSGSIGELRSVYFRDAQTGYIAGSDSFIIKTSNGGINWSFKYTGSTDTLRSIFFTDDTTGYAAGAQGTILKTVDAGDSWSAQVSGNMSLLRSVHFPSHDVGYIAGGNGTILKTTDAGANWISQVSPTLQDLISIRFVSADTGYAVSSLPDFHSGIVLKTTDGGTNWNTLYTDTDGFLCVYPVNNDTVYAVGGFGRIAKTTDGGLTWAVQNSGTVNNLRTVFFIDADTGYAAGELGTQLFTGDGGISWTSQGIQAGVLLGTYFPTSDTGFVVGTAGTVLRYSKPCPIPAAPAQVFGGTTVCEGSAWTYYIAPVPGATSYTWLGPAGSVVSSGQGDTLVTITFGVSSGNVSVTANNGCGSSVAWNMLISVNSAPPIPTISINGSVLQATPALVYQWYFNGSIINGADSSFYSPQQNGSYSVLITNAFGCTAQSAPFSVINAGVPAIHQEEVTVSPIPCRERVVFGFPSSWKRMPGKRIRLYDMQGRLVLSKPVIPDPSATLETVGLLPGLYYYEITSQDILLCRGKLLRE